MEEIASNHPTLSLAFFVAWMTVLVAVVSSLCGIWSKKTSESSTTNDNKTTENVETTTSPSRSAPAAPQPPQATFIDSNTNDEDAFSRPLKLPPSVANLELGDLTKDQKPSPPPNIDKSSSLHNYMKKSTSRRKLSGSISMRMSMKIKDKASEISHHKKLKHEDSLWTKRIMLGEKCRLPNEDDSTILYDDKENKMSPYSQSKRSMSRSSSFINQDTISTSTSQEEKSNDKEKGKEICSDAES